MDKYTVLKETFGFDSFRSPQGEIIDSMFEDATKGILAVMPTSAGKSLLYQLPSLLMDGLTIVVSPLISLMKDQVDSLKSKKIPAEFYNSSMTEPEKRSVMSKIINQELKLLYVAPERFGDANFTQWLKTTNNISLFAVDEAHCISTQGHDFRPSYRLLNDAITYLEPDKVIALTATATKRVQTDICKQLNMTSAKKFISGFYREDLTIKIRRVHESMKVDAIVKDVKDFITNGHTTGIIYAPTRKLAETLTEDLKSVSIPCTFYHAGLSDKLRELIQNNWFKNSGIIVATVAFGMGIDKPDVRFVLHIGMPSSLENYYQEIGRASRDGKGATCITYTDVEKDKNLQKFFIDMSYPPRKEIIRFWDWARKFAKNGLIQKTQKEMGDECKAFMKEYYVAGCISKLREGGLIETVAKGKYLIKSDLDVYKQIDFEQHEIKRDAKFITLQEIVQFVSERDGCRMLHILEYFDDYSRLSTCKKCDVCLNENDDISSSFRKVDRNSLRNEIANVWRFKSTDF